MQITNHSLISFFSSNKTGKLVAQKLKWTYIEKFPKIHSYILNYFNDPNINQYRIIEVLYRIINNLSEIPKCPICGSYLDFNRFNVGYYTFCKECRDKGETGKARGQILIKNNIEKYGVSSPMKLKEFQEKQKATNLEKYGVEYVAQNPKIQEKVKGTNQKRYGGNAPICNKEIKEKIKETTNKRYGNENVLTLPEFRRKIKETNIKRHGVENPMQSKVIQEKAQNTNLTRYGCHIYTSSSDFKQKQLLGYSKYDGGHPMKTKEVKEKIKQTNLYRHGVEHTFQSTLVKEKTKQTTLSKYGVEHISQSPIIQKKARESMKKNGVHTISKVEIEFEQYLIENNIHFISQYKSDLYPYFCDFYIPLYNLYIEIQGHWTHGFHPFNSENQEDVEKLEYWKNKNTPFYNTAIQVWTIKDPEKRKTAKRNNLNYLEVFSHKVEDVIKEFNTYITSINNINSCKA